MSKALIFDFASDFCSAALADVGLGQLHEKRWNRAFTCSEVPVEKDNLVQFIAVKLNELSKVNVDINDLSALVIVVNDQLMQARTEIIKQLSDNENIIKFMTVKSPNSIQLLTRSDCKAACLDISGFAKGGNNCVYLFDVNGTKMFIEKYERDTDGNFLIKDSVPIGSDSKKPYYQLFVSQFKDVTKLDKKLTDAFLLNDFIYQIKFKMQPSSDQVDDEELTYIFPIKDINKDSKKQLKAAKIEFLLDSKKFALTRLEIMQAFEDVFYSSQSRSWGIMPTGSGQYATVGMLAGSGVIMRNTLRNSVGADRVDMLEDKVQPFGGSNLRNVILQGANEILNRLFLCTVQPVNGEEIQVIAPFKRSEAEEGTRFYYDLPITLAEAYTYDEFGSLWFGIDGRRFTMPLDSDHYYVGGQIGPYYVSDKYGGCVYLQRGYTSEMALRIVSGKTVAVYLLYGQNMKNKLKLIGEV